MAGILTPTQIFKDLLVIDPVKIEDLKISQEDGITREEFYLLGKTFSDGQVKAYTVLERPTGEEELNAVLIVGGVASKINNALMREFSKRGYIAVGVDLSGEGEEGSLYTNYPDSIAYARYSLSQVNETSLKESAEETCWFQWDSVLKHLLSYLNTRKEVNKISVIGIDDGAVPVWHVIASGEKLSSAVICSNAGWKGYKGDYKFLKNPEPNFTDEEFKFLAGIEPQAYAMHVKCPLYLLVPTNSEEYECDRAYDTLTRIDPKVFTAINYSVGNRKVINNQTFNGVYKFLEEAFNKAGNKKIPLADEITVSLNVKEVLEFDVSVKAEGLKNLELFIAEKTIKPSLRCFKRYTGAVMQKNNRYIFNIEKERIGGDFVYFAKATFEEGYGISSLVNYAEHKLDTIAPKQKVLFSSREENAEKIFYPLVEETIKDFGVQFGEMPGVYLKNGPKGMYGVTAKGGLITFVINEKGGKPYEDAIFMMDAYLKDGGVIKVKLITDYFGSKTEYVYDAKVSSGKYWQNVKATMKDFKTAEGRGLKNYFDVQAIEITPEEIEKEFAVNNLIWV